MSKTNEKEPVVESEEVSHGSTTSHDVELPAGISEKSLLRKLDRNLLPPLVTLYLLSFLDRSNVGNARVEGLAKDLKMTGNQYLTGLTMYFIGYVIFEIPSNIVLKRTSPAIWLPTITLAWGIVSTLLGVTQNFSGFLVARFFLGVTEAGLFPGICFFLSMWYKRMERQYRIAFFFSAASLAGAFGGILAWSIAHMKGVGHLNGWRWIFILEGLLTVVVAIGAYFWVHNYPKDAKFVNDAEREYIYKRLEADSDAVQDEEFNWANVKAAVFDYKIWLYSIVYHWMALPLYTSSLFLPTIIKDLGYTAAKAQLLTIPPYAIATVFTVAWAYLSERFKIRSPFVMVTSTISIIGYAILIVNNSKKHPAISYGGVFLAALGIYPSCALSLSWPAINVSGQTKRAVGTAMQISIGSMAAVLGTQIYRTQTAPRYILGHSVALAYLAMNILTTGIIWVVLKRENAKRDERIRQGEKVEGPWQGDADVRFRFSY